MGRCAWCLRVFRTSFDKHLDKNPACAILANSTVSRTDCIREAMRHVRAGAKHNRTAHRLEHGYPHN